MAAGAVDLEFGYTFLFLGMSQLMSIHVKDHNQRMLGLGSITPKKVVAPCVCKRDKGPRAGPRQTYVWEHTYLERQAWAS